MSTTTIQRTPEAIALTIVDRHAASIAPQARPSLERSFAAALRDERESFAAEAIESREKQAIAIEARIEKQFVAKDEARRRRWRNA